MDSAHAPAGTTFYFCETCGKRVGDQEARDKKLKGVYCASCAAGVMTIEFDALDEVPGPPQPERRRAIAPAPVPVQHIARKTVHPVRTTAQQKTFGPAIAMISGSVIAATVLIFALSGNSPKTSVSSAKSEPPKPSSPTPLPANPNPEEPDVLAGIVADTPKKPLESPPVKPAAPAPAPAMPAPVPVAHAVAVAPVAIASAEIPVAGDWTTLFDGKSLERWTTNFGKWNVVDGSIVSTSFANNGARVATAGTFDDFELTFEFQDSGRYMVLQLRGGGTSYKLKPRADGWDTVTVKAVGVNVQCSLNGVNVPISDDPDDNNGSLRGEIGFYTRTNAVLKIRNIKIRSAQTRQTHDF